MGLGGYVIYCIFLSRDLSFHQKRENLSNISMADLEDEVSRE